MRLEKPTPTDENLEKSQDQVDKERHDRLADMLRQSNDQAQPMSFAPPGMRRNR